MDSLAPLTLSLADEAATCRLAEDLALAARRGDCFALSGDLGAGKSTFARAFLRALAEDPELEVPSPTFTLVQSYDLRLAVSHFDFYRLGDPDEVEELGFDEALDQGVALVEWPEMAEQVIPDEAIRLRFEHQGDGRRLTVTAPESAMARIRRSLAIRTFLDGHGHAKASRRFLTGDASVRSYETVHVSDKAPQQILMDWPRPPAGPVIEDGLPYARLAHIATSAESFVALSRWLIGRGFVAPEVLASDIGQGVLLLSDLGSDGILAEGRPIPERYVAAAECLAELHAGERPGLLPLGDGTQYQVPDFDRRAMLIETRLLTDWYLPFLRQRETSETERQDYRAAWSQVLDAAGPMENHLLIRDYHSPNILWQAEEAGHRRIGIIDFQDAMIGPTAYDVASLVHDARVDVAPELKAVIKAAYVSRRKALGPFDAEAFDLAFAIMAAQRTAKLCGLWVRLDRRDGKPAYMRNLPRSLSTLRAALDHQALAPLRNWCDRARMF